MAQRECGALSRERDGVKWHYQNKRGAVSPAVACVKPESKFCVNVASDSHSNCCMVNEALCECGIVLVVGGSVNVMA